MKKRRFWLAALCGHFLIIGAISCSDMVGLIGAGHTQLPQAAVQWASLDRLIDRLSPRRLNRANPVRQTVIGYSHVAGIESPYTFFAPNVPNSLRVVFELTFPDGRVHKELPSVRSETEELRLSALIDSALATPGLWRDVVLKMLGSSALQQHRDAIAVHTVVTALRFPAPDEFLNGAQPRYDFVCSSDLARTDGPPNLTRSE